MTRGKKTWDRVLQGARVLRFSDFETLLLAFGFELDRTSGSHIYFHPKKVDRPLSIQPRKGEAKPYQVRQFLDIVEEFGLELGDTT